MTKKLVMIIGIIVTAAAAAAAVAYFLLGKTNLLKDDGFNFDDDYDDFDEDI